MCHAWQLCRRKSVFSAFARYLTKHVCVVAERRLIFSVVFFALTEPA